MKLHWKDGLPYFHFGSRIYTCHQGKDKNHGKKQKYAEKKREKAMSDHSFQRTYNLKQTTKKLDCPVSITVTRVYTLPQFKLENHTRSARNAVSAKIRNKLKNNEDVEGEEAFWYTLPSVNAHKNHTQGEISGITEPVMEASPLPTPKGQMSFPIEELEMAEVTFYTPPQDIVEIETTPLIHLETEEMAGSNGSPSVPLPAQSPCGSGASSVSKRPRKQEEDDREGLLKVLKTVGENLSGKSRDQYTFLGELVANKLRYLTQNGHRRISTKLENGIYRCLQEANEEPANCVQDDV